MARDQVAGAQNPRLTLSALIDDALAYAKTLNQSARDYECKARVVGKEMGFRIASEVTSQDIDSWPRKAQEQCDCKPL